MQWTFLTCRQNRNIRGKTFCSLTSMRSQIRTSEELHWELNSISVPPGQLCCWERDSLTADLHWDQIKGNTWPEWRVMGLTDEHKYPHLRRCALNLMKKQVSTSAIPGAEPGELNMQTSLVWKQTKRNLMVHRIRKRQVKAREGIEPPQSFIDRFTVCS